MIKLFEKTIDSVENAQKQIVSLAVSDETLSTPLLNIVEAQSGFARTVAQSTTDFATAATESFTKLFK